MTQATGGPARPETRPERAVPSSAVRPGDVEHLRVLTDQARIAYRVALDAFLLLETAHDEGRRGTEENATFQAKVALFRQAAHAVHQAARRGRGLRWSESAPGHGRIM